MKSARVLAACARGLLIGAGLVSLYACGSESSRSVTAPSPDTRCALTATTDLVESASAAGASGHLTIGVNRECTWTANTDVDWIALGGPTSGQGPATVPFTVGANAAFEARRGRVAVNEQQVEIAQGAAVPPPPPLPASPPEPPTAPPESPPPSSSPPSPTPAPPAPPAPTPTPTPPTPAPPTPAPPAPTPPAPGPPAPTPPAPTPPAPTPPAPIPPAPTTVALDGRVTDLSGSCPTLTFTLDKYTVRTNAQTSISGGNCRDISDKSKAQGQGTVQPDGSVLATSLNIGKPD